jgi:hypothetical protein
MYTIDWELSHAPGLISFDLGQIIGDLFEMKHFHGLEAGFWRTKRSQSLHFLKIFPLITPK